MTTLNPNCPCPFCPLNIINLQICDVIVTFKDNKHGAFNLLVDPQQVDAEKMRIDSVNTSVALIIRSVIHYEGLAVGKTCDKYTDDHEFHIKRLSKRRYKFCFHSKTGPQRLF